MKKPLLRFVEATDYYYVYNHEDVWLGVISRSRVGKFMHWIFSPQEQTYYTNGCLKELIEFITALYNKDKKRSTK